MSEEDSILDLSNSRHTFGVLVACRATDVTYQLRHGLKGCGFDRIVVRHEFDEAYDEFLENEYPIVFFDSRDRAGESAGSAHFVKKCLDEFENVIMIAVAMEPSPENLFRLIKFGARGYYVPPFTPYSIENVILRASEDPKIDPAALEEPDRNGALAQFILSKYTKLTTFMKQAKLESANQEEYEKRIVNGFDVFGVELVQAVRISKKVCEGGEERLAAAIIRGLLHRERMKTRLGSMRSKLKQERKQKLEKGA